MILINKEEIEITLCHKHNTNVNLIFLLMINGRPSDLHKVDKTLFDFSSLIKYIFLSKGKSFFFLKKFKILGKRFFPPSVVRFPHPSSIGYLAAGATHRIHHRIARYNKIIWTNLQKEHFKKDCKVSSDFVKTTPKRKPQIKI